jgi:hypothetical protein
MLEGYGGSGVVVYHGYVAPLLHRKLVSLFVLPDSRPSLVLPGDSCPSSFFRGNPPPLLRPPRKKLTVLLHAIGNLALCRFYSKTMALRTPVSFSSQLQVVDMHMLEIKAMEEGLFSTRYGGSV